ncbi:hypothetical protein Sjap_007516 [Stephania japonica]|uniref:Transmembrane protein n=1 Tax=Stephania japonica TaxID=461633 RepID=A0AAP0JQ52_9MAGN
MDGQHLITCHSMLSHNQQTKKKKMSSLSSGSLISPFISLFHTLLIIWLSFISPPLSIFNLSLSTSPSLTILVLSFGLPLLSHIQPSPSAPTITTTPATYLNQDSRGDSHGTPSTRGVGIGIAAGPGLSTSAIDKKGKGKDLS